MPSTKSPMASWDATKQQQYRTTTLPTFHMLLDSSGSMGFHAQELCEAYNHWLRWLQRHAPALSSVDTRSFALGLHALPLTTLNHAALLTRENYSPGGGTALYQAIGATCHPGVPAGQHILIVFTDGIDSDETEWTAAKTHALLTEMQGNHNWLCVFLGAFPEALAVGMACGFHEHNCLVFGSEAIPDAFHRLEEAMQRYLAAPAAKRKLLAVGGIF